ncbi:MAG: hypothetical protein NVV59_03420 [Chitinophagaceae bacterium]|nr:hypothetical protein [Chitinophagaceae bacterium]
MFADDESWSSDSEKQPFPATLSQLLELELKPADDERVHLVRRINELVTNDFNRLVSILYRVDVDEEKLKKRLREFPQVDAGEIILDMIIERTAQKPPKGKNSGF